MKTLALDKDIAFAAAKDVANRRARKAGRKAWNREDYNAAVQEFDRIMASIEKEV